jgi:hypothetical protein
VICWCTDGVAGSRRKENENVKSGGRCLVQRHANTGSIETQYLDGEVSEYDLDAWREMQLEAVEAQEDWRAAFELDDDDLLDPDLPMHPQDWTSPVNTIEPDAMYGVEDS